MDGQMFLLLLVVSASVSQISANKKTCACGLNTEGVNACGCQQLVVRPPKLHKIPFTEPRVVCKRLPGSPKLTPIGDACSCGHINVAPAIGPKPPCPRCGLLSKHRSSAAELSAEVTRESQARHSTVLDHLGAGWQGSFYSGGQHQFQQQVSTGQHQFQQVSTGQQGGQAAAFCEEDKSHVPAPADAVSLSLAYGLIRNAANAVREEGLLYGPKSIPRDGSARKTISNVPEERLHSIDRQVMELRVRPAAGGCSDPAMQHEEQALAEEQQKELLEAQRRSQGYYSSRSHPLNYVELGYMPEGARATHYASGSSTRYAESALAHERHFAVAGYSGEEGEEGGDYEQAQQAQQVLQQAQQVVQQADDVLDDSGEAQRGSQEGDCADGYSSAAASSRDAEFVGHHERGY
ncbi:uncharacterized protein LOC134529300 [Bacillus rossius redtenbacheri]|uniref:uncharacterized protein LOC134529300 n=1 Tax=Bacillus rossius redtenbacheri TaxID=93214 RepID=UPI002FDDE978